MHENLQPQKNHPVTPIGARQQQDVAARTETLIRAAAREFGRQLTLPEIRFTLSGQRAGLYAWRRGGDCWIDYNPYVFAIDFAHHLQDTVAHEVAHHVARLLYGHRIKPHGREWQRIAQLLGATPSARGDYSLEGVPVRRQRRHIYHCACKQWQLTTTRHNRIQQQGMIYRCKRCGATLHQT